MAQKVVTKSGKVEYLSRIRARKRHNARHSDPDGSFWADHQPRRDFGVFAHEHRTYKHNGHVKTQ